MVRVPAFALVSVLISTLPLGAQICFVGPGSFPVEEAPQGCTTADFNEDGHFDLAVASPSPSFFQGFVTLLLGDGTGNFVTGGVLDVGTNAHDILAADFDGDGHEDLVVTQLGSSGGVEVLLGDGQGGFSEPESFPIGFSVSVASADLDEDGDLDLVVVKNMNQIAILHGDGAGGFGAAEIALAGSVPYAVATLDLDEDGHLDLAVANGSSHDVSVLLGDGMGSFGSPQSFPAGLRPVSIVGGDFDEDGHLDVAVANEDSDSVSVLMGDGLGNLSAAEDFATGLAPTSIVAVDLDGDGSLDLALGNSGSDDISVLLGNGAGSFADAVGFQAGNGPRPRTLVTADFLEDGHPDLALVNLETDDATVLLGDPSCGGAPEEIRRGDCSADSVVNIADGIYLINLLFLEGPPPLCYPACDVDSNGSLAITDAVYIFNYRFLDGPAPLAPFPGCGVDPTPSDLACEVGCP